MASDAALKTENLARRFTAGAAALEVFAGVDLRIAPGERVAIVGPSGSGKSTLLHLLGGLDRPSAGRVWVNGREISALDGSALADLRNREIGFVWQMNTLLGEFSALENVMLPLLVRGVPHAQASRGARDRLRELGLEDKAATSGTALSGGEQQRVALARALVSEPEILLADEPTGNLDARTGIEMMDLLVRTQESRGLTMVLVTHNQEFAKRCHRILKLEAGGLSEQPPAGNGSPRWAARSAEKGSRRPPPPG